MGRIDQSRIDKLVPELNGICDVHNQSNPGAPLKHLPTDRRVIHLLNDEQYQRFEPLPSTAYCDSESGNIYLHQDRILEHIEELAGIKKHIGLFRSRVHIALLELLNHENVHRSCKVTIIPKGFEEVYDEVARYIAKGNPKKLDHYEASRQAGSRLEAIGVKVRLKTLDSRYINFGTGDVDEMLASHLSVTSLISYMQARRRGIVKNYGELYRSLFIERAPVQDHDPVSCLELAIRLTKHMRSYQHDALYRDYIHGTSPATVAGHIDLRKEEESKKAVMAVFAQLNGKTHTSCRIMDRYGLTGKSEEEINAIRKEFES